MAYHQSISNELCLFLFLRFASFYCSCASRLMFFYRSYIHLFFCSFNTKGKNWHMENIIHISGFCWGFVYHSARHFQYASYFVSSGIGRGMLRTWCCNNARFLRRSSSIIAHNYSQCILCIDWRIYGDFCSYFTVRK